MKRRRPEFTRVYDCDGKQAFTSYAEGAMAIKRIRSRDSHGSAVNLYRCAHCPNWHIGTKRGAA